MKKMLFLCLFLMLPITSTYAAFGYMRCISPWEEVKASDYASMCRLSVPKGWLLLTMHQGSESSDSTIFIPDESHEWVLDVK